MRAFATLPQPQGPSYFAAPTGESPAFSRGFRRIQDETPPHDLRGQGKILYEGPEPGTLIQYFKDDTTAFDATKKAVLDGKGVLNNRISEYLMTQLNAIGVP